MTRVLVNILVYTRVILCCNGVFVIVSQI